MCTKGLLMRADRLSGWLSVLLGFVVMIWVGTAAFAGSIFDDDWVSPSKSSKTVIPPATTKPVGPEGTGEVKPPVDKPTVEKPPVDKPNLEKPPVDKPLIKPEGGEPKPFPGRASRLAVPEKNAQAASRKLMKDVFAQQLKDQTKDGRQKLVQDLLNEVPKMADSPVDRFVLIAGAIDAAREAADVRACVAAANMMAKSYEVDGLDLKRDALLKIPQSAYASEKADENVRAGLEVVTELAEGDDTAMAGKVLGMLQQAQVKDAALKASVSKRAREMEAIKLAEQKIAPQLATLKASPEDGPANLAVGSYLCFLRGQWDRGLAMLAKGSDVELKKVAAAEIVADDMAAALADVADKWWVASEKFTEPQRTKTRQHASALYRSGLATATGLRKALIEKRMAEAPPEAISEAAGRRGINILAMVDVTKDVVAGTWIMTPDGLRSEDGKAARFEFPYSPPPEYDFKIVFTRETAGPAKSVDIMCSAGRAFMFVLEETVCGFEYVDGKGYADNATSIHGTFIKSGQRHVAVIKVRKDGVEAYFDDKLASTWKTDFSGASLHRVWALRRTDVLGFGAWRNNTVVHSAEVIEVTGEGKKVR